MSEIQNPHDRFFKELLTGVDAAQEIARNYLPPQIVARLNLDSMELVKDSWVDADLREHFADVVYRLKWADGGDGDVYLFILFEHKSQPDELTAFQLLRYMVQKWQAHLKNGSLPLPLIIPLVMYHGAAEWKIPKNFSPLFGPIPAGFSGYVPHFEYELLDLSLHSTREIVGSPRVRSRLSLLHSIFAPDLATDLAQILRTLAKDPATDVESINTMLLYVTAAGSLDEADLVTAVKSAFPKQAGDLMPTLAEKWMQQGIQVGEERGRQQGVHTGHLELLTRILSRKFGPLDPALQAQLERLSTLDLVQLSDQMPSLSTAKELEGWLAAVDPHN